MATVLKNEIHPAIHQTLGRLRQKIRSYVLSDGLASLLLVAVALFWISLAIEQVYFSLTRLELPVGVRKGMLIFGFVVLAFSFLWKIWLRMRKQLRPHALALVLERRFPILQDRLITAVEETESKAATDNPLTHSMLDRTVSDVVRLTDTLDLSEVFDRSPLRKRLIAAVVGVLSVLGLQVVNGAAIDNWKRAFVDIEPVYRERTTDLRLFVITQPGDQVKSFRKGDGTSSEGGPGVYKHPRGADFQIMVQAHSAESAVADDKQTEEISVDTESTSTTDAKTAETGTTVDAQTIELQTVELTYELEGAAGDSGHVYLSPFEANEFRHSIGSLMDDVTLWIKGGDYANAVPYRVQMVEPPAIENISLACLYPEYTRLNLTDDNNRPIADDVLVHGTQVALPMETRFDLTLRANKPLVAARIRSDLFEISLDQSSARLRLFSEQGERMEERALPDEWSAPFRATETRHLSIPFHLATDAKQQLNDMQTAETGSIGALPLASDLELRIELDDVDGVTSQQPLSLTIEGTPDQPPVVETRLVGVGRSVTRKAILPVAGEISDDYGLTAAHFEFHIDEEEETRRSLFRQQPSDYPRSYELQQSEDEAFEQLDLLPFDLKVGQKLALTVFAIDGDNLNGPHATRGTEFTFEIVSDEELLSILYGRELNQRRRLEQIISEVEKTREELLSRQQEIETANNEGAANGTDTVFHRTILSSADRLLLQTRKNAADIADMERDFDEILLQLKNNRVATEPMVQRLRDRIVIPLHRITTDDFPTVDDALRLFRLDHSNYKNPLPRLQESIVSTDAMLVHMRAVLKEMQELVKLHAFIGKLKAMIEDQEKLKKSVEDKNKSDLFDALKDLE